MHLADARAVFVHRSEGILLARERTKLGLGIWNVKKAGRLEGGEKSLG